MEWIQNRGWEFVSTGKLELVVRGPGFSGDGEAFRDRSHLALEQQLAEVFRQIEVHRLVAEARAQAEKRDAEAKLIRWRDEVGQASSAYESQARQRHFELCQQQWASINERRAFLVAAEQAALSYRGSDQNEIMRQLEEA